MESPHYVTPEEAENRICVQAMQIVMPMDLEAASCAGPKCMAWRWQEKADWKEGSDLLVTYSTTHGYCGIVRT